MAAKYVLGIDLGTTNSVLAYAPQAGDELQVKLLPIPQLVAAGTIEARTALPSFCILPANRRPRRGVYDLPGHTKRNFRGR